MANYYNNPYANFYQPTQAQPQIQPQIQNGGFVSVRSEEEARNYPVAQGMSVTFKNETAPYIYTKTTGFSQLDRPIFEKFKLIKEDIAHEPVQEKDNTAEVMAEISAIWSEINALKEQKKPAVSRKKEDGGN